MKKLKSSLKPGTRIEIVHKIMNTNKIVQVKEVVNNRQVLIINEQGDPELIEILDYIIYILPLLDRIILWFRKWFRKK